MPSQRSVRQTAAKSLLMMSLMGAAKAHALVLGQSESRDGSVVFTVATADDVKLAASAPGSPQTESMLENPNRAVLNRIISLDVQAQGKAAATSAALSIALIGVDARMPAHNHGMNVKPKITTIAKNHMWRVEGFKLHMDGRWLVSLTAELNGKEEVVSFEVSL